MKMVQVADSKISLEREDGRRLIWDVSIYDRTKFTSVENVFKEINAYWGFIPEEKREVIWKVFEAIHFTLNEITDPNQLMNQLIDLIERLYNEHTVEEIEHWVKFHGNIALPTGLKEVYGGDDIIDRTYLKDDYIGLIVLAIALRPMVPIWGEFILRSRDEVGSMYKEKHALRLLRKASILVSAPMERLRVYIDISIQKDNVNQAAIMSGLGTEELPEWLLGVSCVRRIATSDITPGEEKGSIITNIYAFVSGTLRDLDRKFGGAFREKYRDDFGADSDGMSLLESYKVKQTVSYGDVALYAVYTENTIQMAQQRDPTIDPEMVNECLSYSMQLGNMPIRKHHLVICQWVMDKTIPARGLDTLDKQSLLRVLGVTQALLWHWGMVELALLVSADICISNSAAVIAMESRSKITPPMLKALQDLYPHTEVLGRGKEATKGTNVAVKAIQLLSKELSVATWVPNASPVLKKRCAAIDFDGRFASPNNVMDLLAQLVVRIKQE